MNKKILSWAIVVSLLTAYMLPGTSSDGFAVKYGYPFKFFTIYNSKINSGDTIFNSTALNIVGIWLNIIAIYYIIYFTDKFIIKKLLK